MRQLKILLYHSDQGKKGMGTKRTKGNEYFNL